jgi:hypothetical protein
MPINPEELSCAMRLRTFSMNSQEFYEAVTEPRERPWIPNGSLPREPKARDQEVIVEPRRGRRRRAAAASRR